MNNYSLRDVTEIQFNLHSTECMKSDCELIKIPIIGNTREEAGKVMDLTKKNPRVGRTIAILENGDHI